MKHLYFSIIISFISIALFANAPQVSIGGIINSYGAVSNISSGGTCSDVITVDDATGFMAGDLALVVQMQGATINESNSGNFGNITNLNGAGLYEKIEIASVSGNQITTVSGLLNNYQVSGKVQVVSIPQYVDAEVTTEMFAMSWNGSKGGIIAMEVSGTLTLQADINASEVGFRGGLISNSSSNCTWAAAVSDYFYPTGAWESEGKGEGIAAYISGKEYGKGAQANGGGGGNDHNAGGGGGAGYGKGGDGGENLDPGFFNCKGNHPGVGGKEIVFGGNRIFLGGGGGAGHENNGQSTIGGVGGGIIYCKASTIDMGSFYIKANGFDNPVTSGSDGGGGGGGGGTVLMDIGAVVGNLNIETKGGKGSDTHNINQDRCMGPGGGGGGGAIYSNANLAIMTPNYNYQGGQAGIVTNSTDGCNGSNNNAQVGTIGLLSNTVVMPFNPGANTGSVTYSGCQGDGYQVNVNGTNYNESLPNGSEILMNQFGCDSVVTVSLLFSAGGTSTLSQTLCPDESFSYNGTIYDITNPSGQENIGTSANGCDSIVTVSLSFSPTMTISETANGNDVTINVTGGTPPFNYSWDNGLMGQTNTLITSGNYTVTVTDAQGCDKEYTFFFINTSNEEIKETYGLEIFPNPTKDFLFIKRNDLNKEYMVEIMNLAGQEMLVHQWNNSNQKQIDVSNLSSGIYFVRIYSDEFNFTEKIIIGK